MDMMGQNTPSDPAAPVDPSATSDAKPGFFKTTAGRVVLILGAVMLLLSALAVVGVLIFVFWFSNAVEDATIEVVPTTPDGSVAPADSTAAEAVPTEPADVPVSEVFTFRDIFTPLVKPVEVSTDGGTDTGTGTDTDTDTDVSADTLYLQEIASEDGIPVAVLQWNGQTYRLEEGETIPDSPWQVLSIGSSSVVMLYGSEQVTISVGQGISK